MEKGPLKYNSADIPNFYPEQNMEPLQFLHARCEPCFNDFHFKSFFGFEIDSERIVRGVFLNGSPRVQPQHCGSFRINMFSRPTLFSEPPPRNINLFLFSEPR